ncbi:MAG: 16S ribosomal RNA methyltransferase A [Methanosphaera stadtmanae]|nr:16S ribosomal RNA methyltransferase A [Methanosphaera stadtmanae]
MNDTRTILKKYNLRLDKNKSQNYLIDSNKVKFILEHADIQSDEVILEIGAGIGTLTIPMAKKAKKVIAIEKDPVICDVLRQRIIQEKLSNVELINDDALKIDFPQFDKTISNLPYQISSPVTFKLLEYPFKKAILMYQKEFANRMQAEVGTKNYSRLTVALYFKADCEIINIVKPSSFIPQPKIDSAIIELTPKPIIIENKLFPSVTRALFQHKNKKAKKALIESAHELNSDKKTMKKLLSDVENDLFEEKVFLLNPEEILEISDVMVNLL